VKLAPFIQVDDDLFSISPTQLLSKRGKPMQSCRNGIGLNEIDYGDSIFRFQDSGRLEEATKQASVIQLPNAAVPFAFLKGFVLKQDPASFEVAGFIVSPEFGFAFAPDAPHWVTALAKHCIGTWRALASTVSELRHTDVVGLRPRPTDIDIVVRDH
jgi:hypothetical protein